ncbi:MAG: DUF4268 domain-containing protein [Elusimicrobia bacterium]|nr:DUF4268 domain-containing protein [Elusimicrobiota bacterium]
MANSIRDLISQRPTPTTVREDDGADAAFRLMLENDFSQLPIIDDAECPIGLVTPASILRPMAYLGTSLGQLRVHDASIQMRSVKHSQEITPALEILQSEPAVLVVDDAGKLVGIITPFDTSEFFRWRANDMMKIEDIENTIRDYIVAAFIDSTGKTDWQALNDAISDITPSGGENFRRYESAVRTYVQKQHAGSEICADSIRASFAEHFRVKTPSFEELHLSEFIHLLVHKDRWEVYENVLGIERDALIRHLDSIRNTRNSVAHFRTDIDAVRRDEMDFCLTLLQRNKKRVREAFLHLAEKNAPKVAASPQPPASNDDDPIEVVDEAPDAATGRYAPLATWLRNLPPSIDSIGLSFAQIEEIIKRELPPAASQHRAWWANDSVGHVQSREWLSVDWRVAEMDLGDKTVVFSRIRERQKGYIEFFTQLVQELRQAVPWSVRNALPGGKSWHTISTLRGNDKQILGYLVFAFTRTQQFRVEFYIQSKNKETNKRIFDFLYSNRGAIDQQVGRVWWERLPDRTASRVAIYNDVFITGETDDLIQLRVWAVNMISRFRQVLERQLVDWNGNRDSP